MAVAYLNIMNVLNDKMRYHLMKILEEQPDMNQRQLAKELGISLGKANYCLKALIEKGWIKVGNFSRSSDKKAYAYFLTPKGFEEKARVTMRYLKYKQDEYESLLEELKLLRLEAAKIKMVDEAE